MPIITLLVYLVIAVMIMAFAWWAISQFQLPPPMQKGLYVVLGLVGLIFVIWLLLSLVGSPMGLPHVR
jgi:uncharacterized membrane protein YwzB